MATSLEKNPNPHKNSTGVLIALETGGISSGHRPNSRAQADMRLDGITRRQFVQHLASPIANPNVHQPQGASL